MQTPESSPDRRKSPLSSLTQKSWRNIRSKMQSLSPSPRDDSRGQFVVLSSSLNAQPEHPAPISPPLITVAHPDEVFDNSSKERSAIFSNEAFNQDFNKDLSEEFNFNLEPVPPLPATPPLSQFSETTMPRHERPIETNKLQTLGEPFDECAAASDSDRGSAFSFNRQMSCKYYKDTADMDNALDSRHSPCGSLGSFASYDSYGSFGSYVSDASYVSSADLFYGGSMESDDPWTEDLSHLDEPDCFSALVAEANELPSDDELELDSLNNLESGVRRVKSAPSSWGHSIHRQLTFDSSHSSSPFVGYLRLKRARSTFSTVSSVWPIME